MQNFIEAVMEHYAKHFAEIEIGENYSFFVKVFEKAQLPSLLVDFKESDDGLLVRTIVNVRSEVVDTMTSEEKLYVLNAMNRKALGYSLFQPLPDTIFICSTFVADLEHPQDALDNLLIATHVVARRFGKIHDSFFSSRKDDGTFSIEKWRSYYKDDGDWSIEAKTGYFEGDTQEALSAMTEICAHTCEGIREVINDSVQAVTPRNQSQILYFKGGDEPIIGTFCSVIFVPAIDEKRLLRIIADRNLQFCTEKLGHYFLAPVENGFQVNFVAYKHLTGDLNSATTLRLFMIAAIAEEVFSIILKHSAA